MSWERNSRDLARNVKKSVDLAIPIDSCWKHMEMELSLIFQIKGKGLRMKCDDRSPFDIPRDTGRSELGRCFRFLHGAPTIHTCALYHSCHIGKDSNEPDQWAILNVKDRRERIEPGSYPDLPSRPQEGTVGYNMTENSMLLIK